MLGLSCSMQDLQLQYRGSSSLTRDRTRVPLHWEHAVLVTGSPGKSLTIFKAYNSVALNTFTMFCNQYFFILLNQLCAHQTTPPHFRFPQALVPSLLLSVSMNLPILGTSYKWSHAILSLQSVSGLFSQHNVFNIHPMSL